VVAGDHVTRERRRVRLVLFHVIDVPTSRR
jgi:hypothetical protein